jgi:hypothetical protein
MSDRKRLQVVSLCEIAIFIEFCERDGADADHDAR